MTERPVGRHRPGLVVGEQLAEARDVREVEGPMVGDCGRPGDVEGKRLDDSVDKSRDGGEVELRDGIEVRGRRQCNRQVLVLNPPRNSPRGRIKVWLFTEALFNDSVESIRDSSFSS